MMQVDDTPNDSSFSDSIAMKKTLQNRMKQKIKATQQGRGIKASIGGLIPNRNSFYNGQNELLNTGRITEF